MVLIKNSDLFGKLIVISEFYLNEKKFLYNALFDKITGLPIDNRIPKGFTSLKKLEVLEDRFIFYDAGRKSFSILK
jgi:hypothetical protein